MRCNRTYFLVTLFSLAIAPLMRAGEDAPHVGYVYPAGGQQGTTFEVLLGGQHLDGATVAYVSGGGVVTEVLEHIRPLNQGQFKEMQNRMGELQKKKEEAGGGGSGRRGRGGMQGQTNDDWSPQDEAELAELRRRLATFSIRRTSVPSLVETVTLQVTIAADATPGMRELRLMTAQGLSNPLVFCIGQSPEVTEPSARSAAVTESEQRGGRGRKRQQSARPDPGTSPLSKEPETETDVALPVIVNGQIVPGDVDRYRFDARQGQQFVVSVSARRLIPYLSDAVPGWFQATVALLNDHGHELAFADDFHGHPDPVLHYEIPEDGQYVVEIRDALHRGREDFVYRIILGELPFVTHVFPMGCRAGEETTFNMNGWNLSPSGSLTQTFPHPGTQLITLPNTGFTSNPIPLTVDSLPERLEAEPNNLTDEAQRMPFPGIVNGRIDRPGDVDVFCLECEAATEIVAEVFARRLGSPLDAGLKLTNATGEQLAFNDDFDDRAVGLTTHHADSRLSVRIPESGRYLLHLGDVQQKGGPEYGYRLRVDRRTPDFELRVTPSSINARAGTTVPLTVHALRRDGFAGEIALALTAPPEGFELSGGRVPAGQDKVRVTLTVHEQAESPQSLVIEGRAVIEGNEIVHTAVPADDMMQAFIYRHLVPAENLQVAVTGTPSRSTVDVLSNELLKIPAGGTASMPVRIPGRTFFGEVQLELSDPPGGITIESVKQGRWQAELVFRCDAETAPQDRQGNLIVNAFAVKTDEDSGRGKEQRKKRRILLSALPAIAFEIVERE